MTCHWKLCIVTYRSSGPYQKKEFWIFLYNFCLNAVNNIGLFSKTSNPKPLACKWIYNICIGHCGQLKRIYLIACITQLIELSKKLSSSDSVSIASSSVSVISMYVMKLSNQFSEFELEVSTWWIQSLFRLCQLQVFRVTVGFCTTISAAFVPLAIKNPIQFSVAFTIILSSAEPTLLILEQPKQFSYKFMNFRI